MSAFPKSGRSDHWKMAKMKVRFRPEADPRRGRSEMISAAFALTLLPAKTPPSTFEVGLFLPLANDP
jgi:hypothetical protein